ncbi:methyltransferase-like protein 27, partial [Ruditapes philippinarum]|uniref:methyltransferase-like protein 27 n=1 Tax=Ruditapes philippinarum TaxID=129788 RepID=UPI00295B209E
MFGPTAIPTFNDSSSEAYSYGVVNRKEYNSQWQMANFFDNLRSTMRGMSPSKVAECYTKWTENGQYDKDMEARNFSAPSIIADEVAKCFPVTRDKIKIMDIACGTGLVGEKESFTAAYGFTDIDGLDPSEGMLNQCKERRHYKNLYQEFCGDNQLYIDNGKYDCLLVCGGFGENHIPCSGLIEMIRIVKT